MTEDGERESVMRVYAVGLSEEAADAMFDRVADAAHALDEPVVCSGVLNAKDDLSCTGVVLLSIAERLEKSARAVIAKDRRWRPGLSNELRAQVSRRGHASAAVLGVAADLRREAAKYATTERQAGLGRERHEPKVDEEEAG